MPRGRRLDHTLTTTTTITTDLSIDVEANNDIEAVEGRHQRGHKAGLQMGRDEGRGDEGMDDSTG